MRPIKITMNAFGPYKQKAVVDMQLFGGHGLYLITGDTGAGKTTIFDAVCYALFGTASGDLRKPEMFRCQYADDSETTYVEMIFEYGQKRYRVYREPKQFALKKRGEGYIERNAVGELYDDDTNELIASGEGKVTAAVKEMIGLDLHQYRNVAMIAQGSFAQLLTASTSERTKILSAIFSTENYSELQRRIVNDFGQTKTAHDNSQLKIKTLLGAMKLSPENPNIGFIEEAAARTLQTDTQELIKVCTEAIEFETQNVKRSDEIFKKSDSDLKNAGLELENAKKLSEHFARREDTEKKSAEVENKLKNARSVLEEAQKTKPEIDKLIGRAAAEREKLGEYDAAEKLLLEAQGIAKQTDEVYREVQKLSAEETAVKKKLEQTRAELAALSDIKAELVKCENESIRLTEKLNEVETLGRELKEVLGCSESYEAEKEKLKACSAQFDEANERYIHTYKAYINDQAGILANELEDGMPCPVCGSTEHPEPAVRSSQGADKKNVDELGKALEERRCKLNKQSEVCGALNGRLKAIKASAAEKAKKHLDCEDITEAIELARNEYIRIKNDIKRSNALHDELANKQKQKEACERLIMRLENDLNECTAKQRSFADKLTQLSTSAELKKRTALTQLEKLPFKSKKEAQNNIAMLESKRDTLQNSLRLAEEAVRSLSVRLGELKGELELLRAQTKDKQPPDIEALERIYEKLCVETNAAMEQRDAANACLNASRDTVKQLAAEVRTQLKLERDLLMKTPIYKTASGQVSEKEKILLETYAQMEYFNKILAHANVRLLQMTSGQYELVRSNDKRRNTKTGLDIDVIDHFSASTRGIASLSGGESFMASLALALGFSDEIQQSSGGIMIDSMFVDEGFGTLDDETLEQSVRVLGTLAENSRLIGIISHVTELKEKLDRQIVVKKDRTNGSSVEIIS